MTTNEIPRSTSGLLAAVLSKATANSGHVAPGTDVFSAFRFTKLVFNRHATKVRDRGAAMIEYAMLLALILVVSLAAIGYAGSAAAVKFSKIATSIGADNDPPAPVIGFAPVVTVAPTKTAPTKSRP